MTNRSAKGAAAFAALVAWTACSGGSSRLSSSDASTPGADGHSSDDGTSTTDATADATQATADGAQPPGDDASSDSGSRAGDGAATEGGASVERGGFCTGHWCWSNPLPQGNPIVALWVSPTGRIWAGAYAGVLMTWDGAAWAPVDVGESADFYSVWGTSDTDVWAATLGNALWHFDGHAWTKDDSAPFTHRTIYSISGTSPTDVWIASNPVSSLNPTGSPALHFDGTSWKDVPGAPVGSFDGVRAVSATEVWFTSSYPTTGSTYPGGVFLWDGATWHSESNVPATSPWTSGPHDLWFDTDGELTRSMGLPFAPLSQNLITNSLGSIAAEAIFGTGPDDVWALGNGLPGVPEHRNADGGFTVTPLPEPLSGAAGGAARCGASTGTYGAVFGGANGRLWSANGTSAALTVPPLTQGSAVDYAAVWSDGAGTVLAGGANVTRLSSGAGGQDLWSLVPAVQDSGTLEAVSGIWGSSGSDAWAVSTAGFIFHYDGATLVEVGAGLPAGNPGNVGWSAVAGSGQGDVWAVGTNGALDHYDGAKWTVSQSPGVADLTGVWIDPQSKTPWACGQSGVLQSYTAANGWQRVSAAPVVDFGAITGTSGTDIWLADGSRGIYRYDGAKFTAVPLPSSGLLANVSGITAMTVDGSGGVVAVGPLGAAMRYDGSTWTWEPTWSGAQLTAIWLQAGQGWAVGMGGTILRRRP